jgi:hypothetical protein
MHAHALTPSFPVLLVLLINFDMNHTEKKNIFNCSCIVPCVSTAAVICLLSHCAATDISSGSTILSVRHHITAHNMSFFSYMLNISETLCHAYPFISLLMYNIQFCFHNYLNLGGFRCNRSTTDQINYWSDLLHSSDTGEEMGVQWESISAIHRLQLGGKYCTIFWQSLGYPWN